VGLRSVPRTYFVIEDCVLLQVTGVWTQWPGGEVRSRRTSQFPMRTGWLLVLEYGGAPVW